MYNVSVVSCNCGFRGEVAVGRLMDVACTECWTKKRELRDVWSEDGDEVRSFCDKCRDSTRCFAQSVPKKGVERQADLEYWCEGCCRVQPIYAEDLLRCQGKATCSFCNWVGYPEVAPRGGATAPPTEKPRKEKAKKAWEGSKTKRPSKTAKTAEPSLDVVIPIS